ncbi:MAG: hypothetical protein K2X57_33085 [Xanthobacteraceae bacterium]|nr:hypothetical protein [Xanthobacteraceae bacterium]
MTADQTQAEIAKIVADAAKLPLPDAAYAIWRRRYRLDSLEGRPTDEQVRVFRAMSPAEQAANMRHDREYAQDGPIFPHVKAAHPRVGDAEIKQAISAAVRFEDACFRYFVQDSTDYWERCVNAVARAEAENPGYLESTYRLAANDVAYYYK